MTEQRLVVGLIVLAVALVTTQVGISRSYAQEGGFVVEGRVVNGTADGGAVAGLVVTLHRHIGDRVDDLESPIGPEGWFRFEGITHDPEMAYGVSADYQGGLYGVDLDLAAGAPEPIELTVYDGTDDEAVLSSPMVSMLIADVDHVTQTLWALEITKVVNSSDRAYVPGSEPMKLLRFGLPNGAQGLQVDSDLLGADVIQVDRGFALSASVPPGEYEIMFAYQFPYSGDRVELLKSFPYGTDQFRVLIPRVGLEVNAEGLGTPELVEVGDRLYELMTSEGVERGSRITLDLHDLPRSGFTDRLRRTASDLRMELVAPVVLALLMSGLVAFAVWRRRRALRPATPAPGVSASVDVEGEAEALAELLSELDSRHRAGEVTDEEYARRYTALRSRLATIRGSITGQ